MVADRTPGVYFEWLDTRPRTLPAVRTDIAGFVGIAARGPLHRPVRVESWMQFVSTFGAHIPQGYLAYAVEGFFTNGGRTCWVVRTADGWTAAATVWRFNDTLDRPRLRLTASSPGAWGDTLRLTAIRGASDRFTLIVALPTGGREIWPDLTLSDPQSIKPLNTDGIGSTLITAELEDLKDDTRAAPLSTTPELLSAGRDGLTSLSLDNLVGNGTVGEVKLGLSALEAIDEISIVAMPDLVPPAPVEVRVAQTPRLCDVFDDPPFPTPVTPPQPEFAPRLDVLQINVLQSALVAHCERLRDRVAIIDGLPSSLTTPEDVTAWQNTSPQEDVTAWQNTSPQDVIRWRNNFDSAYAAAYFPWIWVRDPLQLEGLLRLAPPCGHVAGAYAGTDQRVGVHKPPANDALDGVSDVVVRVDDVAHGVLNDANVNVIRPYNGRGIRIGGARTLIGGARTPTSDDLLWRYVNVRRLLIMIEAAIDAGTQWLVFEPNNPDLWRETDRVVRSFLDDLWRRGMLDGATADEAYSVQCDETTNPPTETDNGRMICLVGVQPPWPAEFVVVRIGRTDTGTQILDESGRPNG